jgi:DNA-3-methyladenine glycosylase II
MRRLIDARPGFDPEAWRRYGPAPDPFGTLLRVVTGQQVSTSAASAILGRLSALFGGRLPTPSELLTTEEGDLRSVGLSRQKLAYVRNLAELVESGALDLDRLAGLSDDEVRERLTAVKGIGRWSADMFLLRELGRPDVLPSGDVGICNAVQKAYDLPAPPPPPRWTCWARSGGHTVRSPPPSSSPPSTTRPSPSLPSGHPVHQPSECGDSNAATTD